MVRSLSLFIVAGVVLGSSASRAGDAVPAPAAAAEPTPTEPPPASVAPLAAPQPAPAVASSSQQAPALSLRGSERKVPRWVLPAVYVSGGVALAAGLTMVTVGDRSGCADVSPEECQRYTDYATPGWLVAGAGALTLVGALVAQRWYARRSASTTVAVAPGALLLAGRFE